MRDPRSYGERLAWQMDQSQKNAAHHMAVRRLAALEGLPVPGRTRACLWMAGVVAAVLLGLAGRAAFDVAVAIGDAYGCWNQACWAGGVVVARLMREWTWVAGGVFALHLVCVGDTLGGDGSGGYRSEEDLESIREAVRKKLAVFEERDALGALTQAREGLEKRVGKRL